MFDIKLATHLAELSKIKFTDEKLNSLCKEMDEIINLMDTISDFEVDKKTIINPTVNLDDIRADIPTPSLPREEVLKNATQKDEKAFTVPKVV